MSASKSSSRDPVMSQAKLPPGIDAPSPKQVSDRVAHGGDEHVEQELRRLAERVGGMARLRELVTSLAASER